MFKCPYCGKELASGKALGGHKTKCLANPNRITNKGKKLNRAKNNILQDALFCVYCGKQCKNFNSLKNHEIRCKSNPDRIRTSATTKAIEALNKYNKNGSWNKGLTIDTDERVKYGSEKIHQYYQTHENPFKGKHHSAETRKILSKKAHGHTYKNGTYYKGVYLDSSYELTVAKSLDENNVKWIRPRSLFYTDSKNQKHRYFPDFYLVDYDIYLDPKNDYLISISQDKIERVIHQNNIKLFILDKDHLTWDKIQKLIV